jgi:Ca2+-binding RTX toxin-like protein
LIYGEDTANDGLPLVTDDSQSDPTGVHVRSVVLYDSSNSPTNDTYGNDIVTGGADDDVIFGQLGNDILHGDGQIGETTPHLLIALSEPIAESDIGGDDYIEGNGGNDIIYGGLGQDDIIGGSSALFGLGAPDSRPDGSDIIYGGNGDMITRNHMGDLNPEGHARDADMILGDNGNIFRLVGINGTEGVGAGSNGYLQFAYDQTFPDENRGDLRIVARAAELLDYHPGGPDYLANTGEIDNDIGAADEIHGESGDDFIYGQVGNDILFGEGQDDDIIGGYGHDWISGGTGEDGVLGDDGRIYTSRNGIAEPLYGIAETNQEDISTPGNIQQAIIHVTGELKKTVNLTPFNLDPDTSNQDPLYDAQFADDIIYGGLGDDFLHGGAGDDAISGAEALPEFYADPVNSGNVLRFGEEKAGEFAAYNEYDPRSRIYVDENGVFTTHGSGTEFLLNFDALDETGAMLEDGNDVLFGDLGNDWLVGGTGRDRMYGGWGSDLLNADDNLDTKGGLNDVPDGPEASYEDLAFGGAGRDYLIANTGGDRLIDWAGQFNSYIVPFSPFGLFTISRAPQPQLIEFLYNLSAADGADPTRAADTGADPARNGEPEGELGLVMQKDAAWRDQTGAPDDPMPGNIPGGPRDVLRGANFNSGTMEAFAVDSGVWHVENGALRVAAESLGGDAASVFHVPDMLPQYFEIQATITMEKPTGGWKANSYVIFDYYSPTDFKFAGLNASIDKIQIGHRDATGWHVDVQDNMKIKPGNFYNMLVAVNGTTVTVLADNKEFFSHTFAPRVDDDGWVYGLNSGMVGFGSDNSRGVYDNIAVQILPPATTLDETEDFPNTSGAVDFANQSGLWSYSGGWYHGAPINGDAMAVSLVDLGLDHGFEVSSVLEMEVTLNTQTTGGVVFDYYAADNFKFAAISAATDQLIIGHYTDNGWSYDAAFDMTVEAGQDYELALSLKGTTVNVSVKEAGAPNYQGMVGYVFNAVTVDGGFGLLSKDGSSAFDSVRVKTSDPAFIEPDDASFLRAAPASGEADEALNNLTYTELDPIIEAAVNRWTESSLFDEAMLSRLDGVTFLIADLAGDALALAVDDTVIIDVDAAGHGWFIDDTPYQDSEFMPQGNDEELVANEAGEAYGDMDLLTVVMHELGHVFGYGDMEPETNDAEIMNATLNEGVRYLPEDTFTGNDNQNNDNLVSLDMTPDESTADEALGSLVNENPWLIRYLVDGATEEADPNSDIAVIIDDEDPQVDSDGTDDTMDNPGRGNEKNK